MDKKRKALLIVAPLSIIVMVISAIVINSIIKANESINAIKNLYESGHQYEAYCKMKEEFPRKEDEIQRMYKDMSVTLVRKDNVYSIIDISGNEIKRLDNSEK